MVHQLRNRMLNATKIGAHTPPNSKAVAGFEAMTRGTGLPGIPSSKPAQVLRLVQRVPLPADAYLGFPDVSISLDRDCQSPERTERAEKRNASKCWPRVSTRDGSRGK